MVESSNSKLYWAKVAAATSVAAFAVYSFYKVSYHEFSKSFSRDDKLQFHSTYLKDYTYK